MLFAKYPQIKVFKYDHNNMDTKLQRLSSLSLQALKENSFSLVTRVILTDYESILLTNFFAETGVGGGGVFFPP